MSCCSEQSLNSTSLSPGCGHGMSSLARRSLPSISEIINGGQPIKCYGQLFDGLTFHPRVEWWDWGGGVVEIL